MSLENFSPEELSAAIGQIPTLIAHVTSLQADVSKLQELVQENSQLRTKVAQLERALADALAPDHSGIHVPGPSGQTGRKEILRVGPASINIRNKTQTSNTESTKSVSQAISSEPSWANVLGTKRPSNSVRSPRKRAASARLFQVNEGPKDYEYLYMHLSRRASRPDVRRHLVTIGLETSRVLDVSFPARSVVGLLVHAQYVPTVKATLAKANVTLLADFDPLSPANLGDPQYSGMADAAKARELHHIHSQRCVRVLKFLRDSVAPAVARNFINVGWIDPKQAKAALKAKSVTLFGYEDVSSEEESDVEMDSTTSADTTSKSL